MSDSDEKKVKKIKKKKIPKLPKRSIVIKNKDKDSGWMESWDYPKGRSPADIPHSYRLLALGAPGKGKTNQIKQIFLATQGSGKKFKKLYVVTCDLGSEEWSDCEPTSISTTLPDLDLFDGREKVCLIIDDYEFQSANAEEMRKLTTLFRQKSSHMNLSILASYQSFFHTPPICRKMANIFIIYKPTAKGELQTICNRVGMNYEDVRHMYKNYANEFYDSLMFDFTKKSPYRVRKNIFTVIDYNSDSD